jgi:hypothetical protein
LILKEGVSFAAMNPSRDDLIELSDHAWQRLRERLDGLTDAEYRWEPGVTTLAWRLDHLADALTEERNGPWLGVAAGSSRIEHGKTAADVVAAIERAYAVWREALEATTDESLGEPIGPAAGHYGEASRRSFALHILDEFIHHGAEIALLRDLYASRSRS